jgi:osmotically inducible lipoprotein OsmB
MGSTELLHKEAKMSFTNMAPLAALVSLGLLTAACGNNPTDRALTGGAIGAGTGAVVGSTVGAPIAGAVVGGAAGAVVGAATTPEQPRYYRY